MIHLNKTPTKSLRDKQNVKQEKTTLKQWTHNYKSDILATQIQNESEHSWRRQGDGEEAV